MYIYITVSDANGIILATGRSDQHLSLRGPGLDNAFEGLGVSMHESPRRLVAWVYGSASRSRPTRSGQMTLTR